MVLMSLFQTNVHVYCCVCIEFSYFIMFCLYIHCDMLVLIRLSVIRNAVQVRHIYLYITQILIIHMISLLLYEPYANVSSQICPLLALQPQFHSNHRVHLSTPRYCQSATFGRLTFCVYALLFYGIRV